MFTGRPHCLNKTITEHGKNLKTFLQVGVSLGFIVFVAAASLGAFNDRPVKATRLTSPAFITKDQASREADKLAIEGWTQTKPGIYT